MDLSENQETFVVILTTLFGGAGLEFVRKVLTKSKDREDSATAIRKELREELNSVRAEVATAEKELDIWKQKYYELFEMYILVKVQYDSVLSKLADNKIMHTDIVVPPIRAVDPDAKAEGVDSAPKPDVS